MTRQGRSHWQLHVPVQSRGGFEANIRALAVGEFAPNMEHHTQGEDDPYFPFREVMATPAHKASISQISVMVIWATVKL